MLSAPSQNEETNQTISYAKEIQMMMFGLGDCSTPLLSTAKLIEEIVIQQLVGLIYKAEQVAMEFDCSHIDIEHILFLMRRNPVKINRFLKWLSLKESKGFLISEISEKSVPYSEDGSSVVASNPKPKSVEACIEFLQSVGVPGVGDFSLYDPVKMERQIRADQMSQALNQKDYNEFHMSRQQTFAKTKIGHAVMIEWLKCHCPDAPYKKLKLSVINVLSYFAKETVAYIVDLALVVRQDANTIPGNPFSRAEVPVYPTDDTFGATHKQLEGPPPITPSEVQEVIRRFWSQSVNQWQQLPSTVDWLIS